MLSPAYSDLWHGKENMGFLEGLFSNNYFRPLPSRPIVTSGLPRTRDVFRVSDGKHYNLAVIKKYLYEPKLQTTAAPNHNLAVVKITSKYIKTYSQTVKSWQYKSVINGQLKGLA